MNDWETRTAVDGLADCADELARVYAENDRLTRDALRYRKLRACRFWNGADIVWEEAYLGIVNAHGEALDAAVDILPEPPK